MLHFITSFLRQFFENCIDGNDMGRLEVFLRILNFIFFFAVLTVYILMGLVLQVFNSFMLGGNKRSKKSLNIFLLATMIQIHFFMQR